MFYLKYRPKTVNEIDNSKVKEELKKIISSKKLPHAFLYIGQKGTGKTSTARILAKAINCLENKGKAEPCNHCKNCLAIDSSSSADVLEMDAASNRGIEDVRNLIRESNFLPMTGRYRVFIIDEAHMITTDAFNALLKTLEEPPSSVIFILATTNDEKIPKTIKSRCVIINFGKAKRADIIGMLNRIIVAEKIKVDEKLLGLIASRSDYSFRDAAKILEELVIQNKLGLEEGKKFLGIFQQDFLSILEKEDFKKALTWIEDFNQSGGSFKALIEELLDELRLILLYKNGVVKESELETTLRLSDVVKLIKFLTVAYNELKISPIESLPLEIATAEFYNEKLQVKGGIKYG